MVDLKSGVSNEYVSKRLLEILDNAGVSAGQEEVIMPELLEFITNRDYQIRRDCLFIGKRSGEVRSVL